MKALIIFLLALPVMAGELSVDCDPVTWSEGPVQYQYSVDEVSQPPQETTPATLTVTDCQPAAVRVRAVAGEQSSEWSAILFALPNIEVASVTPVSTGTLTGSIDVTIIGNNFPHDVDVVVGTEGERSWESSFTETDISCAKIEGKLKLGDNTEWGDTILLTLVSEDQSVPAGIVTVGLEIIPVPSGLKVIR